MKIKIISIGLGFLLNFAMSAQAFDCALDGLELRAGIAPTVWLSRASFLAVSCNATSMLGLPNPVIPLFQMPRFRQVFSVPWFLSGRVMYQANDEIEWYLEAEYHQAQPRTFTLSDLIIPNIDTIFFSLKPSSYKVFGCSVGARVYCHDWYTRCADIEVFFGGKLGFVHHFKTQFVFTTASLTVPPPAPFVSDSLVLFKSNTVPAAGLNIGCTGDFKCGWAWIITAEFVVTGGPRANANIPFDYSTQSVVINPVLAPNNFIIGSIGTEIFFPITLGLKYNF